MISQRDHTESIPVKIPDNFLHEYWYQRAYIGAMIATALGLFYQLVMVIQVGWFNWQYSLLAFCAYILGAIVDDWSSWEISKLQPRFEAFGLYMPVSELNPRLPDYPALKEFFAIEISGLQIGLIMTGLSLLPGLLITVGIGRMMASLSNVSYMYRVRRVLTEVEDAVTDDEASLSGRVVGKQGQKETAMIKSRAGDIPNV